MEPALKADGLVAELRRRADQVFRDRVQPAFGTITEEHWREIHRSLSRGADEIERLQEEVEVRRRESLDGAWYWQGDSEDHPESLTCPVIMSAETLRELLRTKK